MSTMSSASNTARHVRAALVLLALCAGVPYAFAQAGTNPNLNAQLLVGAREGNLDQVERMLALGAVRFATARVYGKRRGGLVMMLLGAWGWVSMSGLWGLGWRHSWPLLIIGFGALTVFESLFRWGGKEEDHA